MDRDSCQLTTQVYTIKTNMLRLLRATNNSFQVHKMSSTFIQRQIKCPTFALNQFQQYSQAKNSDGSIKISRKKTYLYTAICAAGLIGWAYYVKREKDLELMKEREKQLKKAGIGGRWELTDPQGNIRTTDDFKGRWCIIYFGFTHCPDICPDEMEKMTAVVKGLYKESVDIQPIFITVDPERDSKEVVGKYVKEFSEKIIGLTGTVDEIKKVCHAFRVYFKAGPKDKDDDYIVDHTITLYLVDPNGEFIDYYGLGKNADDIVTSVLINISKWNTLRKKKGWLW